MDEPRKIILADGHIRLTSVTVDAAAAIQRKLAKSHANVPWQQPQLYAMIEAYLKKKDYSKAEPLIEEHIAWHDFNFWPTAMSKCDACCLSMAVGQSDSSRFILQGRCPWL